VFAETTLVVAAPYGFAYVVKNPTYPMFIEIRSGVSEPLGVEICPFRLLWLLAFSTACTTVQAVTRRPASADRTARRQFQAVFPLITGSFPTNVIAHLHGLSMDLTVGQTVGPTVDSTDG